MKKSSQRPRARRREPEPEPEQPSEDEALVALTEAQHAWLQRRDRLGAVPWAPSVASPTIKLLPSLRRLLVLGQLEAFAATSTDALSLQNLFDCRTHLDDRVVFALVRNPALPGRCFPAALAEGIFDAVLNPGLPLLLLEQPEQLVRVELMLGWFVGAMAASCPTVPGQAIVRDWTAAVVLSMAKRSRGKGRAQGRAQGKGRSKHQRDDLVPAPLPIDEHDWRLTLTDEPWLDAEFLPCFVLNLARRHPHPTAALMALALRLRQLQRRPIGPGSPEEIDQFIDCMDGLMGSPRLTDEPPAPPIPEQLELAPHVLL